MGLHSAEPVDQRLLDMLVVADLDSGALHLGKDDGLLRHCLSHPYMHRLERRVRYCTSFAPLLCKRSDV